MELLYKRYFLRVWVKVWYLVERTKNKRTMETIRGFPDSNLEGSKVSIVTVVTVTYIKLKI